MDNYQVVLDALFWSEPLSTPFFVCPSSEGYGDAAHKRRRVCTQAYQIFTT